MTNLELQLSLLGADLQRAVGALAARRRRRVRRMRFVAVVLAAFGTFAAVAFASGIADDLNLDPTKWTIVGGGSVDGGRGAFVKARNNDDRSESTFLLEHDAGLPPYEAFLLHERVIEAAGGDAEHGAPCSPDDLTRAERTALTALQPFPVGTPPEETKPAVAAALQGAFSTPCRGLEWAGERARFVHAGIEPRALLMPGAE